MDFRANLVKAWNIQRLLTLRTWSTFQVTIRLYTLSTGVVHKVISSFSIFFYLFASSPENIEVTKKMIDKAYADIRRMRMRSDRRGRG